MCIGWKAGLFSIDGGFGGGHGCCWNVDDGFSQQYLHLCGNGLA